MDAESGMNVRTLMNCIAAVFFLAACADKAPAPPSGPAFMPLTMENARACVAVILQAKERMERPRGKDGFIRYAAAVYVAPLRGRWLVRETVAIALTQRKTNPAAETFLKCTVYDLLLTAALTGESFTSEEWREIYVRSGVMDAASFDLLERERPQAAQGL